MTQDLLNSPTPPAPAPAPTAAIPEKFRNGQTGQLRIDALLKSYQELERRLTTLTGAATAPHGTSTGTGTSPDRAALLKALGVPDHAQGYIIDTSHGLFAADPEINQKLHAAGFTPAQAQLVYDLAAERFVPLIQQMAAQFEADRQVQRLIEHFGGEEKWREASRQMLAWGKKNLPPSALEALSTTAEGVLAINKLMGGGEPATLRNTVEPATVTAADLQTLMRDPRYWRDRNPDIITKVTEGFQRLYPQK